MWLKRLGRNDQLVAYVKPQRPVWMSGSDYAALPASLKVRELLHHSPARLPHPQHHGGDDVARSEALSGRRVGHAVSPAWQIETNLRHLKQTLKMDVLHCQSVDGVEKEVLIYALLYNLIRMVMREAAHRQGVPVNRISFIDAIRWLAHAIDHRTELKLRLNSDRPNRTEPRCSSDERKTSHS